MRGERTSVRVARMPGSSARRKCNPCRTATPPLQKEGADLIDDTGTLTDQALADAVQGLHVKLVRSLDRNELHGRTLHCLGNCLRIAEVVLLSLAIRPHVLRRHEPCLVSKRLQLAAEMMRADASLHPDQARRQVGKSRLDSAARPFLSKHDRTTLIVSHDVE